MDLRQLFPLLSVGVLACALATGNVQAAGDGTELSSAERLSAVARGELIGSIAELPEERGSFAAPVASTAAQVQEMLLLLQSELGQIQAQELDAAAVARLEVLAEQLHGLQLLMVARFDDITRRLESPSAAPQAWQRAVSVQARQGELASRLLELIRDPITQWHAGAKDSWLPGLMWFQWQGGESLDAALELLDTHLEEPAVRVLRNSTLPARNAELPARAPRMSPIIVPVYSRTDPAELQPLAIDLADSLDAPLNDEILRKARELQHDYIRIYEFVRNEIRLEWYPGSMKGAQGTLRQGGGNDIDQASLLIALFRASGLPARYVHGVVELSTEQIASSLGLDASAAVAPALTRAGIAFEPVVRGGRVAAFKVEHTWVTAHIPYTNYRGAVVDASGKTWLPLMPAVKASENSPAAGLLRQMQWSVEGTVARYLEEPQAQSPLQQIRAAAYNHLVGEGQEESAYGPLLGAQQVQTEALGLLPSTVPVPVIAVTAEAAVLEPGKRQRLRILVRTGSREQDETVLDQTLAVSSLASERFTLSYIPASVEDQKTTNLFGGLDYVPPYLIKLRPQLKINGRLHAAGTGVLDHASPHYFEIRLLTPAGEERISQTLTAGGYHAIGVAAQAVVERILEDDPADTERTAAALLNRIAQSYNQAWNEADAELAGLLNVSLLRPFPSISIVSNVQVVHRVLGQPHSTEWQGVSLDAAFRVAEPIGRGDAAAVKDWMRLSALQGSNLEARIFEEHFGVDAISADKALALASQSGIALLSVDKANLGSVLPSLQHPQAVLDDVQNWVDRGMRVQLPQTQLTYRDWRGSAWRVEDSRTGAAGYFIAGGLAGGQTAQSPQFWPRGWLADALRSPNSTEPNPDPLAAASITKLFYSDGQIGTAGTALEQPLAVLVRDIDGRPVAQAPVTFVSIGGGGYFGTESQNSRQVLTDELGVAKSGFTLGKRTDAGSVWVMRESGDKYATLAGANVIEASVSSGLAGELKAAPFTAIGYPGEPAALVNTRRVTVGTPSSWAGNIETLVQDQFGNSISNAEVSFMGGGATPSTCENVPKNPVMQALVFDNTIAGEGMVDCPANPMLGDCGTTSKTMTTSHLGASVGVLLGNLVKATYPVTVSSAGTAAETLAYTTVGACDSSPNIHVSRSFITKKSSAVKIGDFHQSPYSVAVRYEVKTPEFDAEGNVVGWSPDASYLRTTATVESTVDNFGYAMPYSQTGEGSYQTKLRAGPAVGEYAVTDSISKVAYPDLEPILKDILKRSTPDNNAEDTVELLRDYFFKGVKTGAFPVLTAIDPSITGIKAREVSEGQDPSVLTLDERGQSLNYVDIGYQIQPSTFEANTVEIDLLRDGGRVHSWIGSSVIGIGKALLNRGIVFDAEHNNQLQVVVNRGPNEVRGDKFKLPIRQKLFHNVSPRLLMTSEVDLPNERFCSKSTTFAFSLSEEARVSLSLSQDDSVFATRLVEDQLFARGEHEIPITTGQIRPGNYTFTLEGTATRTAETEVEEGLLLYEHTVYDNLPIGQTLVKGVNVHSGALTVSAEDMQVPGRGVPLQMQRSYSSSGSDVPGPLGLGWSHNYDSRILITPCNEVIIRGGDGSGLRFVDDGAGGLRPLKGHHGSLVANHSARTFDFYSKDGTRYRYRQMGVKGQWFLEYIETSNGVVTKLGYDPKSLWDDPRVSVVEDSAGRTLNFAYDRRYIPRVRGQHSLLTSISGPDGLRVDYEYDEDGSLIRATRENGAKVDEYDYRTYPYQADPDSPRHDVRKLVAQRNALNGSQIDYDYFKEQSFSQVKDSEGTTFYTPRELIREIKTPDGTTLFAFSTEGERITQVTNERGHTTSYRMNGYGGVVEMTTPVAVTTTEWDLDLVAMRSQSTQMSAGLSTVEYDYDEHGNKTLERTEAAGKSYTRTWTYLPPSEFTPPYIKNRPDSYVDRDGHRTEYGYDSRGNLTKVSAPEKAVTTHIYGGNGDRLRSIDPRDNSTRYQYDAYGYPEQVTDPLGGITRFSHDIRGRQTSATDARGHTTRYEYDDLDRRIKQYDPEEGVTATDYDDAGSRRTETDAETRSTEYRLDWADRVLSISNPRGEQKTFVYDEVGNKTLESNWYGNDTERHDTSFSYDDGDRLQQRNDPLGKQTDYLYDPVGNLLSETISGEGLQPPRLTTYSYDLLSRRIGQTRAGESSWVYEYDGEGHKTAETDPEGRRSEYDYDGLGRRVETRAPLRTTRQAYDKNGNLLSETLVNGSLPDDKSKDQVRRYEYDALNRRSQAIDALNNVSVFDYDAVGNLVSTVNPRLHRTTYKYDKLNRRIEQVVPPNIVTTYGYDKVGNPTLEVQPNENRVEHRYDELNRLVHSHDSLGLLAEAEYDANGNLTLARNGRGLETVNRYNALNQLIEQLLPGDDKLGFSYDLVGNLLSATDARGHTTHNVYDAQDRLIEVTSPAPFNYKESFTYDKVGNRLTQRDRRGHVTTHVYDERNRLKQTTAPAPLNYVQTFEYDAADNLLAETDRRGTRSEHRYDKENRRLSSSKAGVQLELNQYDAVGNVDVHRDANNNRTSYIYNERNLLLTESRSLAAISQYQYDAMGNRSQVRDPEGRITKWTHDKRGRVLSEERLGLVQPLITQYSYDGNGNRTGLTKPLQNHWTYHYDERDRLKQIDDPDANSTLYSYDGNGNRLSQTDARGHTTGYEYDSLNRQIATHYVDSVSEFYDYDENGNRTLLIDGKGQTFTYQFDELNRQIGADYPGSGLAGELIRIAYQYDPNNNLESITEQHRGQSERVTLNRFDAFDRLEVVIDGQGKELRYSFDANGNRTSVRDPDSLTTRYGYDALNRVSSVTSSAGTSGYAYDRSSRKTRVSYPNGSRADYRYDGLGRLEQLSNTQSGALVSKYDYRYDDNGNRLQQTEHNGQAEEVTTYAYDRLDRLSEVAYPEQTVGYGYDAAYNRTSERTEQQGALTGDKTFIYDNRNRLEAITDHLNPSASVSYSHDGNGNQTGKSVGTSETRFAYDARDKLSGIEQTAAGTTTSLGQFRYDHQGLRIEKITDSGTVGYVYDGQSVLTQFDENGETLAKYDYGADQLLSLAHRDQGRQFYLFDALGSVANLTRTDGSIQARYQYDAWGKLRKQSGDSWNSFAFTGHERDKESGLYYLKARFYDPDTGRFLSQDSYLGETDTPPSLHRYLYAYGNPTVYWDPDGHMVFPIINGAISAWALKHPDEALAFAKGAANEAVATVEGTVQSAKDLARRQIKRQFNSESNRLLTAESKLSPARKRLLKEDLELAQGAAQGVYDGLASPYRMAEAVQAGNFEEGGRQAVRAGATYSGMVGAGRSVVTKIRFKPRVVVESEGAPTIVSQAVPDRSVGAAQTPKELLDGYPEGHRYEIVDNNLLGEAKRIEVESGYSPTVYPNPDPPMSAPPVRYEPTTIEEVERMRRGRGPTTRATHGNQNIEAHHRQQIPTSKGGVLDEITEQVHRRDGNHTRHQKPSELTPAERAKEIREHYQKRGAEYILPGEGI